MRYEIAICLTPTSPTPGVANSRQAYTSFRYDAPVRVDYVSGITVVIPAYNAAATIALAVQSAASIPATEIIVVDDGSTDNTADAATRSGARVIITSNTGASMARSRGISEIRTTFAILLDADDELVPAGVEVMRKILETTDAGLVVGSTEAIGGQHAKLILPWREGVSLSTLLRRGSSVGPPSSVLWRTTVLQGLQSIAPRPLAPRYAEDYEILLRALLVSTCATTSVMVTRYQLVGGKSSKSPLSSLQCAEQLRRYYAEFAGMQIEQRNVRNLKAQVNLRHAFDTLGPTSIPRRGVYYLRAFILSPALMLHLVRSRVGRIVAARWPSQKQQGGTR